MNKGGSKKSKGTGRPYTGPRKTRRRGTNPDGSPTSAQPTAVGDILKSLVRKSPLGVKMKQARIWDEWTEIAGERLAPHGRPHGVKNKTLIIQVDSSVWMNVFAYHKWDIIKRINRAGKRELISDIFILLTPEE